MDFFGLSQWTWNIHLNLLMVLKYFYFFKVQGLFIQSLIAEEFLDFLKVPRYFKESGEFLSRLRYRHNPG